MKPFRKYLFESTYPYNFKIKIVGECCDKTPDKIKTALVQFEPKSCSQTIRTPIQESPIDFPEHKNQEVTIFEVSLQYPATSDQIRALVGEAIEKDINCVKVQNEEEENEQLLNHEHDEVKGPALLNSPYEKENFQDLVGEKQKMSLLKELGKESHRGTPYTGVNDKILVKKAHTEKPNRTKEGKLANAKSPLGSRQMKLPDVTTTGGL